MRSNLLCLALIVVGCAILSQLWASSSATLGPLPEPRRGLTLVLARVPTKEERELPISPQELAAQLEQRTGLQARLLAPIYLDAQAYDRERGQFDAERVCDRLPAESGRLVLALTADDLYTSTVPDWRYCFGTRRPDCAIVSSARMGRSDMARERFAKMVFRYVLEGCYGLPRNDRPRSLLFRRVLGPADLDRMGFSL